MFRIFLFSLVVLLTIVGCSSNSDKVSTASNPVLKGDIGRIAFGSCLRQWAPQPVLQSIVKAQPDAFIFMGDNVYSDVGPYRQQAEPQRIGSAYSDLAFSPDFKQFSAAVRQQNIHLAATWDDHDYGVNDGGADYPFKQASKGYFAAFFGLDESRLGEAFGPGVYHSQYVNSAGLSVQLILLDTRSFRSPLKRSAGACAPTGIVANNADDATVLGETQWQWLKSELEKPADLRLIASSIQLLASEHCFEKWANFPQERRRFFQLIKDTGAEAVVLLSGDRHLGEISRYQASTLNYPLYEVTSSGLNSALPSNSPASKEPNALRVGGNNLLLDNFGVVEIRVDNGDTLLALQLRDSEGNIRREERVPLKLLKK